MIWDLTAGVSWLSAGPVSPASSFSGLLKFSGSD